MTRFLLVAAGGALGSMARFGLGLLAARLAPNTAWPMGTFAANILGGLAMGLLVGWLAFKGGAHQETIRLFAAVGVLAADQVALDEDLLLELRQFANREVEAALHLRGRGHGRPAGLENPRAGGRVTSPR